jgi:hypothetical protein
MCCDGVVEFDACVLFEGLGDIGNGHRGGACVSCRGIGGNFVDVHEGHEGPTTVLGEVDGTV